MGVFNSNTGIIMRIIQRTSENMAILLSNNVFIQVEPYDT